MNLSIERDRLLALAEKATPGPWYVSGTLPRHIHIGAPSSPMVLASMNNVHMETPGNAAFIAAAHDMAALIRAQAAEIERLRADLAETKHWESVIAAERDELSRALRGLLDDDAPLRNAGTPELIAFWQSEKEQGRGNAHLYLAAYAALGAIAAEREGES